ncbi:MAG: hypothetical protein KAH32_05105 [Chlamydiia bacterium]|nr:hypothetical protein [Chlamydiia bacterium]
MIRLDNPTQEDWFAIWLDEMIELGYVEFYNRGDRVPSFRLTSEVKIPYIKQLKTKTKELTYSLLKGSTYTADFYVRWHDSAIGKFVDILDDPGGHPSYFICDESGYASYIDVKSPYVGKNCSDVSFSLNRKIIFGKYRVFINKCVLTPASKKKATKLHLYHRYGAPERYFYTDKTMMKKANALKFKKLNNY